MCAVHIYSRHMVHTHKYMAASVYLAPQGVQQE